MSVVSVSRKLYAVLYNGLVVKLYHHYPSVLELRALAEEVCYG